MHRVRAIGAVLALHPFPARGVCSGSLSRTGSRYMFNMYHYQYKLRADTDACVDLGVSVSADTHRWFSRSRLRTDFQVWLHLIPPLDFQNVQMCSHHPPAHTHTHTHTQSTISTHSLTLDQLHCRSSKPLAHHAHPHLHTHAQTMSPRGYTRLSAPAPCFAACCVWSVCMTFALNLDSPIAVGSLVCLFMCL